MKTDMKKNKAGDFPGGPSVPADAGDTDSTPGLGTKPAHHNYQACALKPKSHNYWSLCTLEPVLLSKRGPCDEKPAHHSWRKSMNGNNLAQP